MNKFLQDNIIKIYHDIKTLSPNPLNKNMATLISVSKSRDKQSIINILSTGLVLNFAENYVQEALEKWSDLKIQYPNIKLHLIGHLQTNKIKQALSIFDSIQTIDSEKLAEKISQYNPINKEFYIQVNLDKNKISGINPENLASLLNKCKLLKLNIIGLMAILPKTNNPSPYFAFMKNLQRKYDLLYLSMGMSDDYKEALKFGATHIRIGSKIFDPLPHQ